MRWRWLKTPTKSLPELEARADAALAWGFQEAYLMQVRRMVQSFEGFRGLVQKARRSEWPHLVRLYVFQRLGVSRGQASSTVLGWITMLSPRLPRPLTRSELQAIVRAVASARLLRPTARLRGVSEALRKLLNVLRKTPGAERVWAVALMMAASMRRSDAVRVVGGDTTVPPEQQADAVIVYPEVEKTDHYGLRESEPTVIVCDSVGDALRLQRILCAGRLRDEARKQLAMAVSKAFHEAGIKDVRAVRRDAAASAGGREAANVLLRHQPGNLACTVRYTTTADIVPRLIRVGRKVGRGRSASKK